MADAVVKAGLELDSSKFEASVQSAKSSMDSMSGSAAGIADALNKSSKSELANITSLKAMRKEFNQQKSIIQEVSVKLHTMGEEAKNTEGYQELQRQLQEARTRAFELKESMDIARKSVAEFGNRTKLDDILEQIQGLSGVFQNLGNIMGVNLGGIQSKLNSLKSGLTSVNNILSKSKDNGGVFNTLSSSIRTTISDANKGKGALGELNTALTSATQGAGKLGNAFSQLGIVGKLGWIGAAVAAVAAFSKVAGEAATASHNYEQTLASLQSVTGATGESFQQFSSSISSVAQDMGKNVNDVAKNFETVGSAMPELLKFPKSLEEVSRAAITLADAGTMEVADATEALTLAMNQFGLGAEDAAKSVDTLANATQAGSSPISATAEALRNCGTAASSAGFSLEETTALIDMLAAKGQTGAVAGTQLNALFGKMSTGADELNPKIVGTTQALQNLMKHKGDAAFFKDLGETAGKAGNIIANLGEGEFNKFAEALERSGTAAQMASINNDTFNKSVERMQNAWQNFLSSFQQDSWLGNIFRGAVDGVGELIDAISNLVHAFDPLFEINLDVANDLGINVNPVRDFCEVIGSLINFVAEAISALLNFGNTGEGVGTAMGNIFTALSVVFKAIRDVIDIVTDGITILSNTFRVAREWIMAKVQNIPLFQTMQNICQTVIGWIKTLIGWWNKLKSIVSDVADDMKDMKVDSTGNIKKGSGDSGKAPKKEKEADAGPIADEAKTINMLEEELQKLNDAQKTTSAISATAYKKRKKELEDLIKTQKKLRGIEDDKKTGSKSSKPEAKSGSLSDLNKQMSDFQQKLDAGQLNISTEDAYKRIQKFREDIRKKSIEIGKFKAGSITDLTNQLNQVGQDFNNGLIDEPTYREIAKKLKQKIEEKKMEMNLGISLAPIRTLEAKLQQATTDFKNGLIDEATFKKIGDEIREQLQDQKLTIQTEILNTGKDSIEDLQAKISALKQEIQNGNFTIAADATQANGMIQQLQEEINRREFEAQVAFGMAPSTLKDMENAISRLESRLPEVELPMDADTEKIQNEFGALYRELVSIFANKQLKIIDPKDVAEKIDKIKKLTEQMKVKIAVSFDLVDLQKEYAQIQKDMAKHQSGEDKSSFEKATSANPEPQTKEDRLSAIQAEMDYNDNLMDQLEQLAEKYREMGAAGAEGLAEIEGQIATVKDAQDSLADSAQQLDKSIKNAKKFQKNMNGAADAVGAMGDVFSGLGDALKMPELDAVGIIAGAIANVISGYAAASAQANTMGPWAWLAFAATGLATVITTVAQIKQLSQHASGGIVGGNSRVGDMNLVRVNSGEMILNSGQQKRLWNIMSGSESWNYSNANNGGQVLESRISGRDLVLVLRNNDKILQKTGSKIGLK